MRMFLSILSQFKLIDNKTLSTREVIEILASDNPLVFDFDDAFNLNFEVRKVSLIYISILVYLF